MGGLMLVCLLLCANGCATKAHQCAGMLKVKSLEVFALEQAGHGNLLRVPVTVDVENSGHRDVKISLASFRGLLIHIVFLAENGECWKFGGFRSDILYHFSLDDYVEIRAMERKPVKLYLYTEPPLLLKIGSTNGHSIPEANQKFFFQCADTFKVGDWRKPEGEIPVMGYGVGVLNRVRVDPK